MSTRVRVSWADTKDDFLLSLTDGEWVITKDNELTHMSAIDASGDEHNIKESFLLFGLAAHHTTDWLRFFCNEHHPEVDFDSEFQTNEPGVFGRYQDRFGHDYEEWVQQELYNRLTEMLSEKGYELPY